MVNSGRIMLSVGSVYKFGYLLKLINYVFVWWVIFLCIGLDLVVVFNIEVIIKLLIFLIN